MTQSGWVDWMAVYGATAALKFVDAMILVLALPIFYLITPKGWKNEVHQDVVSWKEPYFKKASTTE